MFADKELEATKNLAGRKIKDIINKEGGSDLDYIRNLQTLITLKETAESDWDTRALHMKPPPDERSEFEKWKSDAVTEIVSQRTLGDLVCALCNVIKKMPRKEE